MKVCFDVLCLIMKVMMKGGIDEGGVGGELCHLLMYVIFVVC